MKTLNLTTGKRGVSTAQSLTEYEEITLEDWRARGCPDLADAALVLPNDIDVRSLEANVHLFPAIIVQFPMFTDGRAYTQARRLRQNLGFAGVIEARGDIGRDQILYMARVGITRVQIGDHDTEGHEEALNEFSAYYQVAADAVSPVWKLRQKTVRAAA